MVNAGVVKLPAPRRARPQSINLDDTYFGYGRVFELAVPGGFGGTPTPDYPVGGYPRVGTKKARTPLRAGAGENGPGYSLPAFNCSARSSQTMEPNDFPAPRVVTYTV